MQPAAGPSDPPTEESDGTDVGELQTSPATGLSLRDLAGPWVVMCSALQGEMTIHEDGFVTFKLPPSAPSAEAGEQLGNFVGRIRVIEESTEGSSDKAASDPSSVTLFRIDLESYVYDRHSSDHPPFFPSRVALTGMVSHAVSDKAAYTTLTLAGHADALADSSSTSDLRLAAKRDASEGDNIGKGEEAADDDVFYAAKLVPWDPAIDGKALQWEPRKEMAEAFGQVFGHLPLEVTSHINRAMASALKEIRSQKAKADAPTNASGAASAPSEEAPLSGPPFHFDLAPYRVGDIPSVYYIPNYISKKEEAQFMQHLKATPEALKSKLHKRTCQEWGGSMCPQCNKSFLADANIPPWAAKVNEMLLFDGIFTPSTFPNSVRIHEYDQHEGIGPHCDGPIYFPLVGVLSLASTSVMHFYPRTSPYGDRITEHYNDTFKFEEGTIGKQQPIVSVVMEPGSLLLFTDEAFTHYPHGLSDKPVDDLTGRNVVNRHLLAEENRGLQSIERRYRASVTVRNLLPRCGHEPERNDYMMRQAWYHYNQLPVPKPKVSPTAAPASDSAVSAADVKENELPAADAPRVYPSEATSDMSVSSAEVRALRESVAALTKAQEALSRDVQDIKEGIAELKAVIGYSFTSATTFQKETSSILNHLSMAVMDVTGKQDDLADDLSAIKEKVAPSGEVTP